MKNLFCVCLCFLGLFGGFLNAQVSITTYAGYSQSFDGLSGTGNAGALVPWNDNSTISGWYAYHGRKSTSYTPGPPANYFVDDGTASTSGEGLRSYGSLSSSQSNPPSDRAMGELSSTADSILYSFAVRIVNKTGYSLNSFSVSYRGEQWKQNTGTNGLIFEYQVDASSIMNGVWSPFPALDFLPLKNGTAAALDGNASDNRIIKTGIFSAAVADGREIWLRWTKKGLSSCGLGVDDFFVTYEPPVQPTNLSFSQVTSTSMMVSFTAAVPNAGRYLVLRKEGSAPAGIPSDGKEYASGDSISDAQVIYCGAGTALSHTGLKPNTQYYFSVFACNGDGGASNYSAANPLAGSQITFAARASLNSDAVPVLSSETPLISSMVNDSSPLSLSTGVQVWQILLRDGGEAGDTDLKPTIVTGISFGQGTINSVVRWDESVLAADLFDGSTRLAGGTVSAQSITFSGLSIIVPDNGSKIVSLRLSLKNSGIIDRQVFQFSAAPQNILTESDSTSSQISSFIPIRSDGTKNVVQVSAVKLRYLQQPVSTTLGNPIYPAVLAASTDQNNNVDIDYSIPVSMTANGAALSGSPVIVAPVLGVAAFKTLLFTTAGSSVKLTASSGTWAAVSSVFQILAHRSFFVDSISGNDAADGLTPATAWKSLTKVNSTVFQPGDSILFRSGCSWTGMLSPKGSGDSTKPIIIDKYGGIPKPVINGNGITGYGTLYFYNQQYWEVNNLEITNDAAAGGDRRGVYLVFYNFGLARHMYLRNLFIHNVKGLVGDDLVHKKTAGIGIETDDNGTIPTRCDDILIEGCTIANIDNQGLFTANLASSDYPLTPGWMNRRFTNVRIRNNIIHHISKNAMIIRFLDGGIIENNVCYETALKTTGNTMFTASCHGTIFQYNEGYFNRASLHGAGFGDGSMYDADLKSMNIIFQYSYSHDNSHGLFWSCTVQQDSGIIVRYNVSKNDNGIIFCINYPVSSISCYNNTVYIGASLTPTIISERNLNSGTRKYSFYNNIIYNLSPSAVYDFRNTGYSRTINNNLFYGFHPSNEPVDPRKMTSDPLFVNPAVAENGWKSAAGFALKSNSPAIDAAIKPLDSVRYDYLGQPVPYGAAYDLGAFEHQGAMGIKKNESIPARLHLGNAYPNPFNPSTTITYEIPFEMEAAVEVFDVMGRRVALLAEGIQHPGNHTAQFEGNNFPSGVYLCRLSTPMQSISKQMMLIK